MAKQLSIIVKAVDEATAPLRGVQSSIGSVVRTATTGTGTLSTALRGLSVVAGTLTASLGPLLAAFSVYGAGRMFHTTAMALDDIGDQAEKLGISIEKLSELRYAADRTDLSFEQLADGYSKALKRIGAAAQGENKDIVDEFRKLAIELRTGDERLRPFEEVMEELVDKASRLGRYQQATLLEKIFGKGGGDFIRFVTLGKENLRALRKEAEGLGVIFTPEHIAAAGEYEAAIKRLSQAWMGLRAQVVAEFGGDVAGVVESLTRAMSGATKAVAPLTRAARDLFSQDSEKQGRAQEAFYWLWDAGLDVFMTGAAGMGRVLATAAIESATVGITALGPPIEDMLRDHLGAVFKSITGFDIQIAPSERGKLASLQEQLENILGTDVQARVTAIRKEMEILNATMRLSPEAAATGGVRYGKLKQEMDDLLTSPEKLRNAIAVQQAIVDQQSVERGKNILASITTGFGLTVEQINSVVDQVQPKLRDFMATIEGIRDEYRQTEERVLSPISSAGAEKWVSDSEEVSKSLAALAGKRQDVAAAMLQSTQEWAKAQGDVNAGLSQYVSIVQGMPPLPFITSEASQAIAGFWQGVSDARDQAFNTFERVREITYGVADSISSGLSGAFVDVISGVKGMKDAFRDFAASTLREISAVIMRLLIMRAITSIAGAFAAPATPENSPGWVFGPPKPRASGGWMDMAAPRYGGGYLHALHEQEYVVSARGTRANSGVLDYMNRGGRVAPVGSGGGGIVINQSITITGGSVNDSVLRSMKEQTVDAVREALRTQPEFRLAVRSA